MRPPGRPQGIPTPAAQRLSEIVHQAVLDGHVGEWVAVGLEAGRWDGTYYPRKSIAVRHQYHEHMCAYVKISPDGMPVDQAHRFLEINRRLYRAGVRIADPDSERDLILPDRVEMLR